MILEEREQEFRDQQRKAGRHSSVNLTILHKRLRQTGTAAPATRAVAALLPEEWHEQLKQACAARYTTLAAYLRELVRQDLHGAGLIRDHRHD